MKPIYIEEDEEITSVIDKIKNVQNQNIELIFPKKSPLIRSIVNLKILKKQAEIFSKNIIISSKDEIGKTLAKKAGLKIHSFKSKPDQTIKENPKIKSYKKPESDEFLAKSVEKLKEIPTPEINKPDYEKIRKESNQKKVESLKKKFQRKQKPKLILLPSFTTKLIITFFIACLIIGIIAVIFLLPQATILITPKTEPFSHNLEMTLEKDIKEPNLNEKIIPYEIFSLQKNSAEKIFSATGEREIGKKAQGQIIIFNKHSSGSQPLVATTRFLSDNNKLFRLKNDIEVPGAKIKQGKAIPGRISAVIEADQAGDEYNIETNNFSIPGLPPDKQKNIFAESLEPITGGESKKITVITSDDLKNAKESLMQEISKETNEEFKSKVSEDKIPIQGAIKNEIIDSKTNGEEEKETRDFRMSIVAKVTAPIVEKEPLQKIIFEDTKNFLPENKQMLEQDLIDGVKFEIESIEEKKMKIKIILNKKIFTQIDKEEIKKNISGKDSSETKNYLMTNPNIYKAEIMLWPFWVKKVPRIKNKIEILEKRLE